MPASTPYEQELRDRLARAERERDQLGRMCAAYEDKFKLQREIVCTAQDWNRAVRATGRRACVLEQKLVDAIDALDEWEKERAKEREHGTDDE
jgi:hypothetical protein